MMGESYTGRSPNQPRAVGVSNEAMKGLAAGILLSALCWAPLAAQERDPSLERIRFALQQPLPNESTLPKSLGILTFVQPTKPGEIVRVSIPIGELVTKAYRGVAAANRRRQEAAARREVEAALKLFAEQQRSPKR
jgi:hypothetical protein